MCFKLLDQLETDVNPEVEANQHLDQPEPVDITNQTTAATGAAKDGPNPTGKIGWKAKSTCYC